MPVTASMAAKFAFILPVPAGEALLGTTPLVRVFRTGADIFTPGERIGCLYQVTSGWVLFAAALADGRRQILSFLLPGDLLPLESLVRDTALRSYQALTAVTTIGLPVGRFREITESDGRFANAVLRQQNMQTAAVCEHLSTVGRHSAYERVVHLLLELWHRLTNEADDSFNLPLTQEIIADALGLSVIHVNRTLQRIRSDRLFEILAGAPMRVRLLDRDAAMHIAGFDPEYLGGSAGVARG